MKHLILAALISVAASGAMAEKANVDLSETMKFDILQLVPDADLSNLTTHQYARLQNLFSNSANLRSGENPAERIRVILASEE